MQVIREDPKNRDLLYVGTEFGLFISMNGGKSWQKFMNNLPTARVDDILVHPRDSDLIVATHARGVWILDDITALQQMTPAVTAADATLFDVRPAVAWLNDQQAGEYTGGQKYFAGENPQRGASINYYLKGAASGDVKVTIADVNGRTLRTIDAPKTAGLNRVMWNLTAAPAEGQGTGAGRGQGGGGGGGRWRWRWRRPRRWRRPASRAGNLRRDAGCWREENHEVGHGAAGHLVGSAIRTKPDSTCRVSPLPPGQRRP